MTYIYHKCTVGGLVSLITNYDDDNRVCGSTDFSNQLFWRECVVIFDRKKCTELYYTESDTDSKGLTLYDEIRFQAKTIIDAIEYIILPVKTIRNIFAGKYKVSEPTGLKTNKYFTGNNHDECESLAISDFLSDFKSKILNITEAKKINNNWNRKFLNI